MTLLQRRCDTKNKISVFSSTISSLVPRSITSPPDNSSIESKSPSTSARSSQAAATKALLFNFKSVEMAPIPLSAKRWPVALTDG